MKIRALRVREVGCLSAPTAVESFLGGLDVLAGPNELGKSTLFRALQAVFTVLHTSKGSGVRDWMVPDAGGAPIIEVDFDIAGVPYRLRKQYFTAAKASLTGLADGSTARGGDAESRLAELLGGLGGPERLGLLWVHQTGTLEDFGLEPKAAADLKGLIERELAAAAGGERVRAVRALLQERLDGLVTGKQRRPRGAFKDAIDTHARLTAERDDLQAKAAAGQAGFERLAVLRGQHGALTDAVARAGRAERLATARAALEAGRTAAVNRRAAEETAKRLQHESTAATAALAAFDASARELAGLAARLAALEGRLAAAKASALSTGERQRAADAALKAHAAREHDLRNRLGAAARAEAVAGQRAALAKRLAQARDVETQAVALKAALAADAATPQLLAEAEAAQRRIEIASAGAVRVAIAYAPGGAGRIALDGKPVPGDADFDLAGPAELTVAGIGRIGIKPAGGDADTAAKLEAAQHALAGRLSAAGVPDIAQLRSNAARRVRQASELGALTARLTGLCPDGADNLQADLEALPDAPASADTAAALTAELSIAQSARAGLEAEQRAAMTAAQQAGLALARLEADLATATQRHAELLAGQPASGDHRQSLAGIAEAATERAQQALLELSAHRAREPGPEQVAALQRELGAATAAETEATAKAHAHATEMAGLEASLRRDAIDGIGERLAECEGALEAAGKRLDALRREIAALMLLDEQFEAAAADTSVRYLAPMTQRLLPYLATMLPEATLGLGDHFGPEALRRGGRSERIERLSEGTREQVAVLVRLGLARLLADGGESVPLVLDDALVYSDDSRIARAFAALREAASHHQVIVLTCRAKAFEPLGGTRLALTPWRAFTE